MELVLGQQETSILYVVNELGWERVFAYILYKEGEREYPYRAWPGVEMFRPAKAPALAGIKAENEDKIFAIEFPYDYNKVSFNNGETGEDKQETAELTWEESKPYFVISGEKDGEGHYQGEWKTQGAATALDNIIDEAKAVKFLHNGQLLILKGNEIYNVQGQRVSK